MKDRVFVASILDAFGYSFTTARERQDPSKKIAGSPRSTELLMQALSPTLLTIGGLVDPPYIVEVSIANRWSRWTITADGPIWTVARKRKRGRPRRTASDVRKLRAAYTETHAAARFLRKELLKAGYPNALSSFRY